MTPDIGNTTPTVEGMTTVKGATLGTIIGVLLGTVAWTWWQMRQIPKDNKEVDTGEKTADGKPVIDVTGVGGEDDGKKVKGYALPSSIKDVKLPLAVVVKPNKNLFLEFKSGQKVTFVRKRGDELIWIGKIGEASGEYVEWYPKLLEKVLGAV